MSGINFSVARPTSGTPASRASASTANGRSNGSARRSGMSRPALDSDEDEAAPQDELLAGFDRRGAVRSVAASGAPAGQDSPQRRANQSAAERRAAEAPLVIPSLPNKAWLKPKTELYKPDAAITMRSNDARAAMSAPATPAGEGVDVVGQSTGAGGLRVGELKSGSTSGAPSPSLAATAAMAAASLDTPSSIGALTPASADSPAPVVESEDQRALRELLAGAGESAAGPQIDVILPTEGSRGNELLNAGRENNELDNFRASLQALPDSSSLEDYERVPIGQFGAALLRGMSRSAGAVTVAAKVPEARPDFLGLGAKPMPTDPAASNGRSKPKKSRRDAGPYMPLVKRAIEGSQQQIVRPLGRRSALMLQTGSSGNASPLALSDRPYDSDRGSARSSRRNSPRRSDDEEEERRRRRKRREREERDRDERRESDRDRDRDRDRRRDRERDSDRSSRRRSRSRSPRRDRDRRD